MTSRSHDQAPTQDSPEEMSPFDLAVHTARSVLDWDPRSKHRDAKNEPVTEGLTRSIEFGDCTIQEFTDAEGNVRYHHAMIGGDFKGFFVDLDPQTGEATKGMEVDGVSPAPEDLLVAEDHDYQLLNVAFPVEFTRAAREGEIVFPSWPKK